MSAAKCVTGWGSTAKTLASHPHPALMRFAYSRHPPRKGEGGDSIRRQRNLVVDQRIQRRLDVGLAVDDAGLL